LTRATSAQVQSQSHARLLLAALLVLVGAFAPAVAADDDAWSVLKKTGHVVFMRHSDAPGSGGYGDPPGYRLDDCATQRNLSEEGRAHALRTGLELRKHAVRFDRVFTSPWCRCKDTARLMLGKDAEVYDPLSNLVGRAEHRDGQVKALKAYLAMLDAKTRVLFVTHGIVIGALTGINPASGEMVIVKVGPGGEPQLAGRLKVD
jgi:phosphohistidine phosphatase SixA